MSGPDGLFAGAGLESPFELEASAKIVPNRPGQMKNSYPFLNRYKDRLPLIAMAVQDATLTYINPATKKQFTHAEFVGFARDFLGVDIIFWDTSSPWLKVTSAAQPASGR